MSTVQGSWRGSNIVKDGLVLYLDAGSPNSYNNRFGQNWRDISGNSYNGTLENGPSFVSSNGSFLFDGLNTYVDNIGSTSSFDFIFSTGIFSISFWLKINSLNNRMVVMGNTLTNTEKGFVINIENGISGFGNNCLRIAVAGNAINTRLIAGSTDDNTTSTDWDYWTFVSTNNNFVGQWYKNGITLNTTTRVGTGNANQGNYYTGPSTRTLNLGRANSTSTSLPFNGSISQTKIYNRTLSQVEVLQNFNSTKSRFGL